MLPYMSNTNSTKADTMSIAEIHDYLTEQGVSPVEFWAHAMGGDRAALPREDVERCVEELRSA